MSDLRQPRHGASFAPLEPFVFPGGPPHQVHVEPTEEVEQLGSVEASVVVDPPCTMLLNMRARSPRDLSLRLARCQERISALIAFFASVLTAGRNDTKWCPVLLLANRGRNS